MSTERLCFGIWQDEDSHLAARLWGDPAVGALTGGPFTAKQVAQRLSTEIETWRLHRIQYWPMFRRDAGTFVGCCGLRPRDLHARTVELGFQLCRDAWGQGLAAEASHVVIARAGADGFAALFAGHHPENHASRRTLKRLGFRYTHDEFYPPTGLMEPCYLLRIDGGVISEED